ncbi:hypothetical protein PENDEC_c004G02113 [Penicillium decumbens]|uniref:Uncharacterized protein n=1 Tax=Penicillium decumbens TaxID=69771 RepID=A0A1V6PHW2_PENDC|nr:hypothetical protein PENDEC_c004G02113 [Penicillium decumbens]
MTPLSKSEISAQYQNYSIYVMLKSRGALPGFHWLLFIPTTTPFGGERHATNETGGWNVTPQSSDDAPFAMGLVLAYKIGSISPRAWEACKNVLDAVPYDYTHSPNFSEPLSCRVWVKDALVALQENRIIALPQDLSLIERELVERANLRKEDVEQGRAPADVVNFIMN